MMSAGQTVLQCEGLPESLGQMVRTCLAEALAALALEQEFGTVRLSADDLPGHDDAWYRLVPGTSGVPGPVLLITCHGDVFCRHRPLRTALHPPPVIWDQLDAPRMIPDPSPADYSAERTAMFLHHHLLTINDLRHRDLVGEDIPRQLLETFAAAWAVGVDGRLARRHLPGYPIAERRGRFSQLFSSAGILLPDHWQIFQSLWDGALEGQRAILGIARQLPRLSAR